MTKTVSVIMPVYNAAKTLPATLDALFAQTHRPLELLFIDDCCTDESFDIIARYAKEHESDGGIFVKTLHHEKNRGVAAARNTGLDNATGEYVYYADADDTLAPDALTELLQKASDTDADIVGCEWYLAGKKNERHMRQPDINSPEDAFRKMTGGTLRWNLWLFLVKRALYETNQIRFMESQNMGEDMMAMGKLFLSAQKVCMLHKPFYRYMQTNFTYLEKENSAKHRLQVTRNVEELERFTQQFGGSKWHNQMQFLKLNIKLPMLITDNADAYREWQEWFPEANAYVMQNKMLPLRTRLLQQMAAKGQFWFVKLYYRVVIRFVYGVIYK